jgi:hypothetical protein
MPWRIAYFRTMAAEAEKEAQKAKNSHERERLLAIARAWTKIADQAQKIFF